MKSSAKLLGNLLSIGPKVLNSFFFLYSEFMMPAYKTLALTLCLLVSGCSSMDLGSFKLSSLGFGGSKDEKPQVVKMPPPAVTQARLDDYEPKVKEAIKGTHFEYERRENILVITAPVQGAFNPDRPNMMLPSMLGPLTRMAKMVESDDTIGVLILGHADSSGDAKTNLELSEQRARAFTSIFRMSGLKQNRLTSRGLGSVAPRAANDSAQGRALNRRVEIMLTSKDTLNALIAQYSQPAAAPAAVVADVKKAADKNAKTVAKAEKPVTRN